MSNSAGTGGGPCWSVRRPGLEIRFVGRQPIAERSLLLEALGAAPALELAALEQVHSATVVEAAAGGNGRADGLWTDRRGLALSVVTADCVPLVIWGQEQLAVVHCGWRGIAAGIVAAALARFDAPAAALSAWIGPAIGPCCYEVGPEVDVRLRDVAGAGVSRPGPRGRPHLDLALAVERLLAGAGIATLSALGLCTRCNPSRLHSYRLEGPGAGRNHTFAWLAAG